MAGSFAGENTRKHWTNGFRAFFRFFTVSERIIPCAGSGPSVPARAEAGREGCPPLAGKAARRG